LFPPAPFCFFGEGEHLKIKKKPKKILLHFTAVSPIFGFRGPNCPGMGRGKTAGPVFAKFGGWAEDFPIGGFRAPTWISGGTPPPTARGRPKLIFKNKGGNPLPARGIVFDRAGDHPWAFRAGFFGNLQKKSFPKPQTRPPGGPKKTLFRSFGLLKGKKT